MAKAMGMNRHHFQSHRDQGASPGRAEPVRGGGAVAYRGLWRNIVLVWMGEFGRTPRINRNAGRDHWARCWSIVVVGAIKGGQVYGSTDSMAVATNLVKVGDVYATLYRALGIDPTTQIRDLIGRPFAIAGGNGRPVEALF